MAEINTVDRNKQKKQKQKPQRHNQQNHNQHFGKKKKAELLQE